MARPIARAIRLYGGVYTIHGKVVTKLVHTYIHTYTIHGKVVTKLEGNSVRYEQWEKSWGDYGRRVKHRYNIKHRLGLG